jgi:transcriptional regulator with XRE-family HTH domain
MTTLAPHVRTEFAKRLKVIRTQRGFPRARYFASTLGIEENRYTRYERAEVEPSLTLIHKMCETLGITPNELLGFEDRATRHPRTAQTPAGFAEGSADASARSEARDAPGAMAWALAAEIVAVQYENEKGRKGAPDPLEVVRETGAMYRSLLAEPFETVAKLAEDPALSAATPKRRAQIAALMSDYTATLRR